MKQLLVATEKRRHAFNLALGDAAALNAGMSNRKELFLTMSACLAVCMSASMTKVFTRRILMPIEVLMIDDRKRHAWPKDRHEATIGVDAG
jgi:hypothetical protein